MVPARFYAGFAEGRLGGTVQSLGGSVGRSRMRMLVALLAVISATGCVLTPLGSLDGSDSPLTGAASADRVLTQVVRRVVRDNTGSFQSELIFGGARLTWGGVYSIRASRGRFQISLVRGHQGASMPTTFDVVLVGDRVFVRPADSPAPHAGPWVQTSKRHLFVDLRCWPAEQRALPDRMLMLLFNADAVRFDPQRGRSVIIATVPARLVSGVFPEPSLGTLLSGESSAQVTVRIGQFRGQVTTFEVEGKAVLSALEGTGARLSPKTSRDLREASYFAYFPGSDLPTLLHPPRARSALDLGPNAPLPQWGRMCATGNV